jgi:2-dehydropantoate 2-reductase
MRYVVIGAGAIGGAVGGRLHQHGHSVILVARGPHFEALARDGLRLRDPDGEQAHDVPVVNDPAGVDWDGDDVVVLATKTHQTPAALEQLVAVAPNEVPILCLQNGVANERMGLRLFPNVHGVVVMLPATHLEPGSVVVGTTGITGILDIGRVPDGTDELDARVAADLTSASFSSRPAADVMAWKRTKLLMNLGNAIEAACADPESDAAGVLAKRARVEAEACFTAAEWNWTDDASFRERRRGILAPWRPADGTNRVGGSTLQSLLRRTGNTEVDYLNGEIVLLGRLHGIATPTNELLQATIRRLAQSASPPGSLHAQELLDALDGHP